MLFDSQWEVMNVRIGKSGVFELADIETELFDHRLEARNSQLHICGFEANLIDTVIADEEIRNGQMTDMNPSIGRFVLISLQKDYVVNFATV